MRGSGCLACSLEGKDGEENERAHGMDVGLHSGGSVYSESKQMQHNGQNVNFSGESKAGVKRDWFLLL